MTPSPSVPALEVKLIDFSSQTLQEEIANFADRSNERGEILLRKADGRSPMSPNYPT